MLPQRILDQFARIPHNTTIENKYYGVFDKILTNVDDTFTIEPQYPLPQVVGVPTIDIVATYVEVNDLPIFFLEINPPLHLDHISSRVDADAQMMARFRALYNVPTPKLHGVSVWDKGLRFIAWTKPRAM